MGAGLEPHFSVLPANSGLPVSQSEANYCQALPLAFSTVLKLQGIPHSPVYVCCEQSVLITQMSAVSDRALSAGGALGLSGNQVDVSFLTKSYSSTNSPQYYSVLSWSEILMWKPMRLPGSRQTSPSSNPVTGLFGAVQSFCFIAQNAAGCGRLECLP